MLQQNIALLYYLSYDGKSGLVFKYDFTSVIRVKVEYFVLIVEDG